MSEHPNLARLRGAYEAYGKGDLDHLTEVLTPDIRWHEPGRNKLSGKYTGPRAMLERFVRTLKHRGEHTPDVLAAHLFRFEDDRAAEFWEAHTDQAAVDAFFA